MNANGGTAALASDHLLLGTVRGQDRVQPSDWVLRGDRGEWFASTAAYFAEFYAPARTQEGEE